MIMSSLAQKECVPCKGGVPPLAGAELEKYAKELGGAWRVVDGHHLNRVFVFPDFVKGLAFVNRVGELAEQEGHHPNLHLTWGRVEIDIWTHKIDGLTESDFVLAAKIDQLPAETL